MKIDLLIGTVLTQKIAFLPYFNFLKTEHEKYRGNYYSSLQSSFISTEQGGFDPAITKDKFLI
jgi:hypothetical protein